MRRWRYYAVITAGGGPQRIPCRAANLIVLLPARTVPLMHLLTLQWRSKCICGTTGGSWAAQIAVQDKVDSAYCVRRFHCLTLAFHCLFTAFRCPFTAFSPSSIGLLLPFYCLSTLSCRSLCRSAGTSAGGSTSCCCSSSAAVATRSAGRMLGRRHAGCRSGRPRTRTTRSGWRCVQIMHSTSISLWLGKGWEAS